MMSDSQISSFRNCVNKVERVYGKSLYAVQHAERNIIKSYLYKLYHAAERFYKKERELRDLNDRVLNSKTYDEDKIRQLVHITNSYISMSKLLKDLFIQ